MNIEIFSLCDAATADVGKVNILGAFDTLFVEKLPAIHPQCAVAIRVRFQSSERGEHRVALNIVDEDGRHVVPGMQGTINVTVPEGQQSGSVNLILNLQGLKFEKLGEYSIDLAIDDRQASSLPLLVRERMKHRFEPMG